MKAWWLSFIIIIGGCATHPKIAHIDQCRNIPARLAGMRRPDSIEGAKTYVYRHVGGVDLRLHAFFPQQPHDNRAAILYFFGGTWMWGTVDAFVSEARYLASRGMVAIAVDYRVLCRDYSTPYDSVSDARAALQWVAAHAQQLKIDPHKIVASGESAGAQLALMTALSDDPVKPAALVLYSAALDLTDVGDFVRERFGASVTEGLMSISPFQHVRAGMPPTLILNGESDESTPFPVAQEYCKKVISLGNQCKLVGFPNADHGFFNAPGYPAKHSFNGKWFAQGLAETDRFLDSLGYLYDESP